MHNKRAERSRQNSNKTWFWHGYEILNTMDFQGVAWNEMVVLVQVKSEQVLTMTIAPSWFPLFCLQLKARERKGKAGQSRVSFSLSARGCLRGKGNTELVCLSLLQMKRNCPLFVEMAYEEQTAPLTHLHAPLILLELQVTYAQSSTLLAQQCCLSFNI